MKTQSIKPEEYQVSLEINVRHGTAVLMCLLLVAGALLGYLRWGNTRASAQAPESPDLGTTGLRRYYLTQDAHLGDDVKLGACDTGFHFASLWEIMDTSNLEYDYGRGLTSNDSGNGPPSYKFGWVRTGYVTTGIVTSPGEANCSNWTKTTGYNGTTASLPIDWEDGADNDMFVWDVGTKDCSLTYIHVWCVED